MTHLHFQGNCSEAFRLYAETFGGRIACAVSYGEAPGAEHTPAEVRHQIIHARLDLGRQALTGCDVPAGCYQTPQGFNVMGNVDTPADAERIFKALAQEGKITVPFQETFWAQGFGKCTDRFGIPWMINCAKPLDAVAASAKQSA